VGRGRQRPRYAYRVRCIETEYAFGVIVMDVMWGAADSYPDSGYLNVQYDDDDNEVRFTRGDLRPHLLAVIAEAVKRTEAES
jgi:hypothetical protein